MPERNLTRETLCNKLYINLGFSKTLLNNLISDTFNEIISGLLHNGEVKISSFGTFKTIRKKARIGRNPKTKEDAKISARRVVAFRASKKLKNKLKKSRL